MKWLGIALAMVVLGAIGTTSQTQRGYRPYDARAQRRRMLMAGAGMQQQNLYRRQNAQQLRHAWRR